MGGPAPTGPRPPSWWKGAEVATANNLEAARQMGYSVMLGN